MHEKALLIQCLEFGHPTGKFPLRCYFIARCVLRANLF
jgi:hypothetical protein